MDSSPGWWKARLQGPDRCSREERIVRRRGLEKETRMREAESDGRIRVLDDGRESARAGGARDASLGELFKRLSDDSSRLVRQEIALAKLELKHSAGAAAGGAAKIGIAAVLALPGLLAVTAA